VITVVLSDHFGVNHQAALLDAEGDWLMLYGQR
jgi:hypothetical protein